MNLNYVGWIGNYWDLSHLLKESYRYIFLVYGEKKPFRNEIDMHIQEIMGKEGSLLVAMCQRIRKPSSDWDVSSHLDNIHIHKFQYFFSFPWENKINFTSIKPYTFTDKFCIVFLHNYVMKTLITTKIVKCLCVQHMSSVSFSPVSVGMVLSSCSW